MQSACSARDGPHSAAATRSTRHCVSSARRAAGLSGLLSTWTPLRARFLAHMRTAVGGDQDGGEIGAEAPAQLLDRLDAVAVVEMVVDQETVGRHLGFHDGGGRGREVGRLEHPAAPAAEQRVHAVEDGEVVVDAQHGNVRKVARDRASRAVRGGCWLTGRPHGRAAPRPRTASRGRPPR